MGVVVEALLVPACYLRPREASESAGVSPAVACNSLLLAPGRAGPFGGAPERLQGTYSCMQSRDCLR
jgi:hypothetical protein